MGGQQDKVGGQKNKVGGQQDKVGGQKNKVGGQKNKVGGQKNKGGSKKQGGGSKKQGAPEVFFSCTSVEPTATLKLSSLSLLSNLLLRWGYLLLQVLYRVCLERNLVRSRRLPWPWLAATQSQRATRPISRSSFAGTTNCQACLWIRRT